MADTSKSRKPAARKKRAPQKKRAAGEQELRARVVLHLSEDVPNYYVNYIEIASSQNDFSLYGVRVPTKMSTSEIEAARKSGEFHFHPDVEIVFPVTIIQGLIDALVKQRDLFVKTFGGSIPIKSGDKK